jgi:NADPH2:quinone reductase
MAMRAIQVHETGGPEQLRLVELPLPEPRSGQVRVKVVAAGLNFIEIYYRTGLYPQQLPFTLGAELAGTVDAVGPDVSDWKVGDRVATVQGLGSYAEYALVPAARLVAVPDALDLKLAAAVLLQGMTAHYLALSTYPLKQGDTALIHAAAGGTGQLLVQIAKMRGARVFGTVSTEEKAALAREAGVDEAIFYTRENFTERVRQLTDDCGVDVVYDSVGKDTFDGSIDSLRQRGYMVSFGNASGAVPPISPLILSSKGSLFLTRPTLFHYIAEPSDLAWRAGDIFGWVASGTLKVRIDRSYPLEEAAAAHIALAGRETAGKVLLIP